MQRNIAITEKGIAYVKYSEFVKELNQPIERIDTFFKWWDDGAALGEIKSYIMGEKG